MDYDISKIKIRSENYYCSNCNGIGHTYKYCKEGIISCGIICVYIPYEIKKIELGSEKVLGEIDERIKFVIVERRHSLGYIEFVRGRYDIYNLSSVDKLIRQMTKEEVEKLKEGDFDKIWESVWGFEIKSKREREEYIRSRERYYKLGLKYKYDNSKCEYSEKEIGIPKGRRELYESDIICSMREFEEETLIKEDEYIILENEIIKEEMTGTNGKRYVHKYYIGILKEEKVREVSTNEISGVRLMSLRECLEEIRPYHKRKKEILTSVYNGIKDLLK